MILWTIQMAEALDRLERKGRLEADWRRVEKSWLPAFRWMAQQMTLRLGIRQRRPPVWAWHSYLGARKRRPDLRSSGHLPRGATGVRIEFDAPEGLVLLSDFDMWHCALNNWYLALSDSEDRRVEALKQKDKLPQQMIVRSWERMFALGCGSTKEWGRRSDRVIQACVPRVEAGWVRRVDRFTAR